MKKLISRKEAAELLQVHPQTISNYADKGILKEVRKGRGEYCYYYDKQVRAMMPSVQEIEDNEKEILAYKAEIEETKKRFKEIKDEWQKKLHTAQGSAKIYECAIALLKRCTDNEELVQRERYVINAFLNLKATDEIATKLGYSNQTIRNIFHKAMRRLMIRTSKAEKYDDLKRVNQSLESKILELEETIRAIKAIKVQEGVSEDVVNEVADSADNIFYRYPALMQRIDDLCLSVRANNCLKAADIDTLADLVSYSRNELKRFRNFGVKSLQEIDLLLERKGLQYGMLPPKKRKSLW